MYLVRPPYLIKKIFPKAIWRMNPLEKKIYLTFDDGPIPEVTPWVLSVLKQENIKATFFCVGANVVKNPEIFNQIVTEKHSVGNHTFNHLNGWNTDTNKYIENVNSCSEVVHSTLFRPPYGKLKNTQIDQLTSNIQHPKPYSIIMWDILSGDYDAATTPEKCLKNTTDNLRNGSIILFHDSVKAKQKMEYALPRFIVYAKENGFEFCTL